MQALSIVGLLLIGSPFYDQSKGGALGSAAAVADLDIADWNIKNPDVIYTESESTDTAATDITIRAGSAYEYATVETAGAPLYLGGGLGAHKATAIFATADGTILSFTACDATGCTTTSMTEGTHWNKDTSDDLTCAALETYVDGLGLRFATTCVANVLWLNPAYTTLSLTLTSSNGVGGGTKFAVAGGAEGVVSLGHGGLEIQGLTDMNGNVLFDSDGPTYIGSNHSCTHGGVTGSVCIGEDAGGVGLEVDGKSYFDDVTYHANTIEIADDTQLALGHRSTDGWIKHDTTQTPNTAVWGVDTTSRSVVIIERQDGATDFKNPLLPNPYISLQSSDATRIGERTHYNYQGLSADHPVTDIDPHNTMMNGADAWSQATAGQRDGATVHHSAGIRTLQHVCSDRTLTDTDTITITVNGSDTVLTESTDFDCEGEASEEVCCDNIGAAITAALGATIVVPDCATTAGTCYLQFDQRNVHAVDDIAYVDGGVDGTGWTLTEGVDGSIAFHTAYNALVVGPDGISVADYTRALVTEAYAAALGPSAPTTQYILDSGGLSMVKGLGFDSTTGEEAIVSQCVPLDWEGASDWTLRVVWYNENADIIQNTEDVDFYAQVRTVASGESMEAAAVTAYSGTYIGSAGEADAERYDTDITIDYDDGTNALTAGDCVHVNFRRNVGGTEANSYSGEAVIAKFIFRFTSTGLARN